MFTENHELFGVNFCRLCRSLGLLRFFRFNKQNVSRRFRTRPVKSTSANKPSHHIELIATIVVTAVLFMFIGSSLRGGRQNTLQDALLPAKPLKINKHNDSYVANTVYHQQVDHFSNDHRAMSPRSWSQIGAGDFGPPNANTAPEFGYNAAQHQAPPARIPKVHLPSPPQRFAQFSTPQVQESRELYETQPLKTEFVNSSAPTIPNTKDHQSRTRRTQARPVGFGSRPAQEEKHNGQESSELKSALEDRPDIYSEQPVYDDNDGSLPGGSEVFEGTPYGDEIYGDEHYGEPLHSFPDSSSSCGCQHCQSHAQPHGNQSYQIHEHPPQQMLTCQECGKQQRAPKRRCRGRKNRKQPDNSNTAYTDGFGKANNGCGDSNCTVCCDSKYAPELGHRSESPITRGFNGSSSEKFTFEEDGDFPPINEILAQSVFFSELEYLFIQPSFQGNTALSVNNGGTVTSTPFNFDLESGFRVMGGFESEFGPGFAGEYFQFDNNSDRVTFTSDGVATGETRVLQLGTGIWTSVVADAAGEAINTFHSLEVHSTSVYAFKAIKFKRAFVNGKFGIRIINVDQELQANLVDANGQIGSLNHVSHLSAFGPRFGIDYVRKIGHTPAQLISSASTSLLFGDREQIVENTVSGSSSIVGADEFVAIFDVFFGVQTKRIRGEKRNITTRIGFVNQTWINGGTAINPNADFGFQGLSFMLGFNR